MDFVRAGTAGCRSFPKGQHMDVLLSFSFWPFPFHSPGLDSMNKPFVIKVCFEINATIIIGNVELCTPSKHFCTVMTVMIIQAKYGL